MRRTVFIGVLGLFLLAFSSESFSQEFIEQEEVNRPRGPKFVAEEIVVQFAPGTPGRTIERLNRRHKTEVLEFSEHGRFHRLRIPKTKTVEEMVAIYSRNPNVKYAEPNFIASALFVPNDPYYQPYQWHLDNNVYGGINMEMAWDVQTGSSSVIVAVVDTGVAYENYGSYTQAPDLANTSFVPGYDFINNDAHANDDAGHGTHVAGTIAQSTNNGMGVAGVAFGTTIMPVKVLGSNGSGSYTSVANGIYHAANNGAQIINMSLGGTSSSLTLLNALVYADNAGVSIFCSAGNGGPNGSANYPAAYSQCIAVAATRYDQLRAPYSTIGSYVDIAAPGGDTSVDQNGDGYGDGVLQMTFGNNPNSFAYYFYQGTSMASPHAAGVGALLYASGVTHPDDIREALEMTAIDLGVPGWDSSYGHGLIDAYQALTYFNASPPPPEPEPDDHDVAVDSVSAVATATAGDLVIVDVDVSNVGDVSESFTVTLIDTTDNVGIGVQNVINLAPSAATGLSFNWDTTGASEGDHILRADASVVIDEINTANNSAEHTSAIEYPVYDVAVTNIDTPLEVTVGDNAVITVTVENEGTETETTDLTLEDDTDNDVIGVQGVTLGPGEVQNIQFNWDTSGSSIQLHTLTATLDAVIGETDTADNAMSSDTDVVDVPPPPVGPSLSVADITMQVSGWGSRRRGRAYVTILDHNGQPVSDAQVTVDWYFNGAYFDTASASTRSSGQARINSDRMRVSSGDVFTATVVNVSKSGYDYNDAANVETSDSVVVP